MRANPPNRNTDPAETSVPVIFGGRDSFWAERHSVGPVERVRKARKKWQCLACGKCGFVETVYGEDRRAIVGRIGHGCQPESMAFYTPGAHRPLRD